MTVPLIVLAFLVNSLDLRVADAAANSGFAGSVNIGSGRKMYLKCTGKGSPAVVLIGGLRASAEDWDISDKSKPTVFAEIGKFTRVCKEQPQLVIYAIREVVEAVRTGKHQLPR